MRKFRGVVGCPRSPAVDVAPQILSPVVCPASDRPQSETAAIPDDQETISAVRRLASILAEYTGVIFWRCAVSLLPAVFATGRILSPVVRLLYGIHHGGSAVWQMWQKKYIYFVYIYAKMPPPWGTPLRLGFGGPHPTLGNLKNSRSVLPPLPPPWFLRHKKKRRHLGKCRRRMEKRGYSPVTMCSFRSLLVFFSAISPFPSAALTSSAGVSPLKHLSAFILA